MSKKFPEYRQLDLPGINLEMMDYWLKNDTFRKSLEIRDGYPDFIFYEGPPSANGIPGIHHVIARTIKDIFCRYKTQKGYRVLRKAGWDTHGLPVELSVEKMLGITKDDIGKTISVSDYNDACRKEVMKYTDLWEDLTHKMGYWVDMDHPYITCDNRYIETLWWILKQFYNKGLLYKGYTIQPYSPAAGTGLSSHELNQPGCYRDVKDTTVTALFEVNDEDMSKIVTSDRVTSDRVKREDVKPEIVKPVVGKFPVIAGCFKIKSNADRLHKQLIEKGYPATMTVSRNGLYKVSMESFASRQEAMAGLARLKRAEPGMQLWAAL